MYSEIALRKSLSLLLAFSEAKVSVHKKSNMDLNILHPVTLNQSSITDSVGDPSPFSQAFIVLSEKPIFCDISLLLKSAFALHFERISPQSLALSIRRLKSLLILSLLTVITKKYTDITYGQNIFI